MRVFRVSANNSDHPEFNKNERNNPYFSCVFILSPDAKMNKVT